MSIAIATPSEVYNQRLEAGLLSVDDAQLAALPLLDALCQNLQNINNASAVPQGFFARLFNRSTAPKGLYFYGPVGRGKSLLMDLLFDCVPHSIAKRRLHFHQFMREVHTALAAARANNVPDALAAVAATISDTTRLLCFDEMVVKDVADAMILERLFKKLFAAGVVCVFTSNSAPEDLYAGGLQRARFTPFIDLVNQRCQVAQVAGELDYRRMRLMGLNTYLTPLGAASTAQLQATFDRLSYGAPVAPLTLNVDGRLLVLKTAARGVLFSTFAELCQSNLGPNDMLEIAACCQTVIMDGVPVLTAEARNETLRFITLIDALYDARRRVFIAAAAAPDALCVAGPLAADFKRTASRLAQMQSEGWGE